MSSFWLLLVTIIICLLFPTAVNAELAFVRPNTSVLCAGSQQPCLTFNEYAQQVDQYFVDNSTFLFLPGTHELTVRLDLEGLSNISFIPVDKDNNDSVHLLIGPLVNITWTNCEMIEFSGLVFILSGQFSVLSESDIVGLYSAELIFQETTAILAKLTLIGNGTRLFAMCNSSDVQINNLMAKGIKAPTLYAFSSAVDFFGQSTFESNSINIAYKGCILFFVSCCCNYSGAVSFISNTGVTITAYYGESYVSGNLSFVNNTFTYSALGAINFFGGTSSISGKASFINNSAPAGGSQIQLLNGTVCYIPGNVSFLQNRVIWMGIEKYQYNGGVAIYAHNSTLSIIGVAMFARNQLIAPMGYGIEGGAIRAIYQSRMTFEESANVVFAENSATTEGGAVSMDNSNLTMYGRVLFESNSAGSIGGAINGEGMQTMINCSGKNITFRNNTSSGGGAILAFYVSIELKDVLFERNAAIEGGAIAAFDALINMTGTTYFLQNSASQLGGAMVIGGFNGTLQLTEPLMAHFVENSAGISGGVVAFDDRVFGRQLCSTDAYSQNCFIKLSSSNNIRLNFTNNDAEKAGRIFYGGDLDKCSSENLLTIIASISNVNINVSNFKDNTTSNVSSDPLQVCICKSDGPIICDHTEIETVRGREFPLQAVIVGQGMGAVPSAIRISLENSVQILATQRIQPTGKACTNISYHFSAESNTTVVTLFPDDGPCKDFGIGLTLINVTFLPCPNGFIQNGSECVCEERLQIYNAICNVDVSSIKWTSNNMFWLGAVYDNESNESTYQGLILYPDCPFDYCVNTPVPITLDNLNIQCNHNHSGTLCGSCREGYSITLGTLHCLPCSNDYLALILPFALAGITLVAVLLLLRLTVTAGTINGLIFYANIVQANNSFFFPAGEANILTIFIAWLNLDLGIETCFYDGMTTYAYTWLQFVFPFYVWFLIGLIILASHYSTKLTRIFGHNPVAALATLFLLSYSKLLRTIIASLSFAMLEYPDDDRKSVWFYDGTVAYGSAEHVILVIFAILVLVFLFIPYTLLLFFAHWLRVLSHWRILSWLNKIKPFMDTYHAPYKKQTRYWTGLLLFVRLVLAGTIANDLILVVIISLMVAITSLAWMQKGIYENYFNNILEAFFIANLSIFAATMYTYRTNTRGNQDVIAYSFVGLAFAVFICIMLFHAYLVLRKTAVWKEMPKPNVEKYFIRKKEEAKDLPPGDDRGRSFMLQGREALPTQTTVDLREPLLEQ